MANLMVPKIASSSHWKYVHKRVLFYRRALVTMNILLTHFCVLNINLFTNCNALKIRAIVFFAKILWVENFSSRTKIRTNRKRNFLQFDKWELVSIKKFENEWGRKNGSKRFDIDLRQNSANFDFIFGRIITVIMYCVYQRS